jgi:hypothetical protein
MVVTLFAMINPPMVVVPYVNARESFANQDRANVKGSRTILMRLQSRGLFRCFQSFLHLLDLRHQLLFGGALFAVLANVSSDGRTAFKPFLISS